MRFASAVVFASLLVVPSVVAQVNLTLPDAAQQEEKGIDPERLRQHVKTLASDEFEGRAPGQPGGEKAARYIADQFKAAGLEPAGDHGTYFQQVPMVGVKTDPSTAFALVPTQGEPMKLTFGTDYVANNQTHTPIAEIDAPLVFVGHGIVAPEYGWDDYKGVDVKGKVAVVIVNEPTSDDPKFFNGKSMTYYGRWTYKFEEAGRHGAVACLIVHRTDLASYGWQVVQNSWSGEHSYLRDDPDTKLKAASWITHDVADKLFATVGMTADEAITAAGKRGFVAKPLPVRLKAHVITHVHEYESANVVGKITGAKPGRTVLLYTAHYDHFGIDRTRKGDPVFHGAADNATGTAIVMEMARAFGQKKIQPPSTVIFAAVTAEEQGLLGSQYLGMHPPVPAKDISLDINYDELLPLGDVTGVGAGGAQRTTAYPILEALAAHDNLTLRKGGVDAGGGYYRSDHFSLARVGIPAFSLGQGGMFVGHDEAWGREQSRDFGQNKYHTPADVYSDSMDFTGNAHMARFGFELGWIVMSQPERMEWLPGDEFEAARKRQ